MAQLLPALARRSDVLARRIDGDSAEKVYCTMDLGSYRHKTGVFLLAKLVFVTGPGAQHFAWRMASCAVRLDSPSLLDSKITGM